MNDWEIDSDLQDAARRVSDLSRRVAIDAHHKARLREELMRRHQELAAEPTQRAAGKLWPRFSGLKRLTLVAPPALAAALALTAVLWSLQISGHQQTQAAEAAKLTRAFAHTAPTVSAWNWTLHQDLNGKSAVYRLAGELTPQQQLYIRSGATYLQSGSRIFRVTAGALFAGTHRSGFRWAATSDFKWAFATVPSGLLSRHLSILPPQRIGAGSADGVRYTVFSSSGQKATITAWIDPSTGLLMRLQRVVSSGVRVIETDRVDYSYTVTR